MEVREIERGLGEMRINNGQGRSQKEKKRKKEKRKDEHKIVDMR